MPYGFNDDRSKHDLDNWVIRTNDYNDLINKPHIGGVELRGDRTFAELGMSRLTNLEIEALLELD